MLEKIDLQKNFECVEPFWRNEFGTAKDMFQNDKNLINFGKVT